jgi:endoglucanase
MTVRGINLAGALEERHFDVVREAGFDTVRLPVKWQDEDGFERVDRTVERALARGLRVVLDVHHLDELSADPDRHRDGFLALWARIGEHYADADPRLCFELLNEPHEPMTAGAWNELLGAALAAVRATNPERLVLAGPVQWNTIGGLAGLVLPDDEHLAVTVHYYSPFAFTH